jgi:hypothetical protein
MNKRFSSGPPQFSTTLYHSNSVVVQHVANPDSTKMFLMILVSEVIRHTPQNMGLLRVSPGIVRGKSSVHHHRIIPWIRSERH